MLDEVPVAFVRAAEASPAARAALAETIRQACRGALAEFKQPREVRVVDELPRSTLEKIAKAELRKLLAAERAD
jgi:crotonobetaine/carnitine-CoA ligase